MLPGKVRIVGHDEDGADLGQEVALRLLGMGEAKDPLLAEGDCHNRGTEHEVLGLVVVRSNVVAEFSIVPVEEQAIESVIDSLPAPGKEGIEHGGDWLSFAGPAAEVVILAISLLPAGQLGQFAHHLEVVETLRMEVPKDLEPGPVRV
jgi:hypothetical protein